MLNSMFFFLRLLPIHRIISHTMFSIMLNIIHMDIKSDEIEISLLSLRILVILFGEAFGLSFSFVLQSDS